MYLKRFGISISLPPTLPQGKDPLDSNGSNLRPLPLQAEGNLCFSVSQSVNASESFVSSIEEYELLPSNVSFPDC
jgi:hypothetical protein